MLSPCRIAVAPLLHHGAAAAFTSAIGVPLVAVSGATHRSFPDDEPIAAALYSVMARRLACSYSTFPSAVEGVIIAVSQASEFLANLRRVGLRNDPISLVSERTSRAALRDGLPGLPGTR